MKTIISLILCLLLALPLVLSSEMVMYNPPPSSGFGNSHYYSVSFDEEGDAVVMAKITVQNMERSDLRFITLEIPGQAYIINAVQELRIPTKDYWNNKYEYKTVSYQEVTFSSGTSYTFILAEPLKEQQTTTIFLYYKARGYVYKNMGEYNFNFKTIKSSKDISFVRVAVNVQQNLYLKGAESEVNYVDNFPVLSAKTAAGMVMDSSEMQRYSYQIESASGVIKTASGLDPFESMIVSGVYGKSRAWLHRWSILSTLVVAVMGIFGLLLLRRNFKIKRSKNREIIFAGIISAVSLLFTVGGGVWILDNLHHWMGYPESNLIGLLLGFAFFLMTLALLILPPIYIGKKHQDYMAGIMTSVTMVGTMIVLSLGLILVLKLF